MKDTLFVPSFGNRPRTLVGREDILNRFVAGLDSVSGSRERSMLVLGQRGLGKTVLLLELADIASDKGYVVASPTVASADMTDRILEKLIIAGEGYLHTKEHKVTGGSVSVLGFGAGIQLKENSNEHKSFAARLSELCTRINNAGHPVLILVDEVQANHEELRKLVVAYQELIGMGIDIAIVLAGLPVTVSVVLNDHVLTFLNRAVKIELMPIGVNEIIAYYRDAFTNMNVVLDKEQIVMAAQKTGGSPYMMQLIGHYITLHTTNDGSISPQDYDLAIASAESDFKNDICKTTLAALSDRDIDYLTAMTKDDIDSELSQISERLGVTSAYVQTYKRRLISAGIIEQHRRGKVRFAVPYLADYLRENEGY